MNGRNRRRKDVPFNPFAPNAAAERNRRQAERAKEKRRQEANTINNQSQTNNQSNSTIKSLDDRVKEAQQKLSAEKSILNETIVMKKEEAPNTIEQNDIKTKEDSVEILEITETVENLSQTGQDQSRADRIAELKRKSQESKNKAKQQSITKEEIIIEVPPVEAKQKPELPMTNFGNSNTNQQDLNVFKTIKSSNTSAGISKKKRKMRNNEKKGGGRQRLEKKLNKQKILEFRYAAREILDDPEVPSEHRSNILGQIIAKGERISIDSAIEFIEQKSRELIITEQIADKLKQEMKVISTRR